MNRKNQIRSLVAATAKAGALSLVLFLGSFFYTRAQDIKQRLLFPFDDAVLYREYMGNDLVLKQIDSLLSVALPDTLLLSSWSSPEGNFDYNYALSRRRAQAVRKYLVARYPSLSGRVTLSPNAESWDELRSAVLSDEHLSAESRLQFISIIDSDQTPDAKERKLAALPAWRQFYRTWFRNFRFVELHFPGSASEEPEAVEAADSAASVPADSLLAPADTSALAQAGPASEAQADTLAAGVVPVAAAEQAEGQVVAESAAGEQTTNAQTVAESAAGEQTTNAQNAAETAAGEQATEAQTAAETAAGAAAAAPRKKGNVRYPIRRSDIDEESNAEALKAIETALDRDTVEISRITITGYASPDGSVSYNKALALRRAESLRGRILRAYPALAGKVEVVGAGEDWEGFRRLVAEDTQLSAADRAAIEEILDADLADQAREEKLRQLSSWDYVYGNICPQLRRAGMDAVLTPVPELPVAEEVEIGDADSEIEIIDTTAVLTDTLAVVAPLDVPQEPEPEYIAPVFIKKPIFAAGTNVVSDLLITPHISLDFPIGQNWSINAEYTFPWWVTRDNARAWEMLKWDLGARWWFSRKDKEDPMDILRGHFLGLELSGGYYDVEPLHNGYQGEFGAISLLYGYGWKLSPRWRMEAFLGLGWMGTGFRYYEATQGDNHLIYQNDGRLNWVGPTKVGLSFKYIFTCKVRVDQSGRTAK